MQLLYIIIFQTETQIPLTWHQAGHYLLPIPHIRPPSLLSTSPRTTHTYTHISDPGPNQIRLILFHSIQPLLSCARSSHTTATRLLLDSDSHYFFHMKQSLQVNVTFQFCFTDWLPSNDQGVSWWRWQRYESCLEWCRGSRSFQVNSTSWPIRPIPEDRINVTEFKTSWRYLLCIKLNSYVVSQSMFVPKESRRSKG